MYYELIISDGGVLLLTLCVLEFEVKTAFSKTVVLCKYMPNLIVKANLSTLNS